LASALVGEASPPPFHSIATTHLNMQIYCNNPHRVVQPDRSLGNIDNGQALFVTNLTAIRAACGVTGCIEFPRKGDLRPMTMAAAIVLGEIRISILNQANMEIVDSRVEEADVQSALCRVESSKFPRGEVWKTAHAADSSPSSAASHLADSATTSEYRQLFLGPSTGLP
jgi:hypothetical protein